MAKRDIDILQGEWTVAQLEVEGSTVPSMGAGITITGDRFTTRAMGAEYEGTLELGASGSVRTIDLLFTTGPEQGNRSLGIYEILGKKGDRWRLCLTLTGTKRPATFATGKGSGLALETLERAGAATQRKSAGSSVSGRAAPVRDLAEFGAESGASSAGPADEFVPEGEFEPVPELAGEWSMVSGMRDGFPLDARMVASGRRVVRGNDLAVYFGQQLFMKARFRVDRAASPKTIDFILVTGPNAGKTQKGIYRLENAAEFLELTTCFSEPGLSRPTQFVSQQGDGRTLSVWKRKAGPLSA